MKQNILIFNSATLWKNQLNGMIEIISKELNRKNNVFILSCDSSLESCPPNNKKNKLICDLCQRNQYEIYDKFLKSQNRVIKLKYKLKNLKINFSFKNYSQFKDYQYDKVPFGMLVSSDLVTFFRDSYLNFFDVKNYAISKLKSSILLYQTTLKVIKKHNIDVVYSWNGRRIDGPVLYAAKKLKKKYFSYISSHEGQYKVKKLILKKSLTVHDLKSNKEDISKINLKEIFNSYSNIKEYLRNIFNTLSKGERSNNDFKTHKYFKKKDYQPLEYQKKKKLITIFTSTLWEHSSLGKDWFLEFENRKLNFLELLNLIINNKKILKLYDFIIKWHPNHLVSSKNELDKIERFIVKNNHVKHYRYNQNVSIYDLIDISDNVITVGSTTGIEFSYLNSKKSILVGPSYSEDLKFVKRCKNFKQLLIALRDKSKLNKMAFLDLSKFIYWNSEMPSSTNISNYNLPIKSSIIIMIYKLFIKINEKKK